MAVRFTRAVIVGVGLIGGSLGMILRRKALAASVVGTLVLPSADFATRGSVSDVLDSMAVSE